MKVNEAQKNLSTIISDKDLEIILCHVLGKNPSWLVSNPEYRLSSSQEKLFLSYLKRREANEPVCYILGHAYCFGRKFVTNKKVLIPRPETEELLEIIIGKIKDKYHNEPLLITDIGTGSGAIAITLAKELKNYPKVFATDISSEALEVAKENAKINEAEVEFFCGHLLEPIIFKSDIIVANLPYIPSSYLENLDPDIKYYEPEVSLDGGPDGLTLINDFLIQAKNKINKNGLIFMEIWHDQAQAIREKVASIWPEADVDIKKDLSGHDRFVIIGKF